MGRSRSTAKVRVVVPPRATDGYSVLVNELARGEDVWEVLTSHERLLLIAGITCKDGWEAPSIAKIDGWIKDLGRDRQEAVRRGLREKGFLTLRPTRVDEGPDAGMIVWEITFYMHPIPAADRDQLPAKKDRAEKSKPRPPAARNTVPGKPGHGKDQQETAGHSMPASPGHGNPGHGNPGPDVQGNAPYIRSTSSEELSPPTPAVIDTSPSAAPKAANAEGEKTSSAPTPKTGLTDDQPSPVAAAADWVLSHPVAAVLAAKYRNWRQPAVAAALAAAVADGRGDAMHCAGVLLRLAAGEFGVTWSANRLTLPEKWWDSPSGGVAFVPASRTEEERCEDHPWTYKPCRTCLGEALGRENSHTPGPVSNVVAERSQQANGRLTGKIARLASDDHAPAQLAEVG